MLDDFSGEKRSREQDYRTPRAFCKACNMLMANFDPDTQSMTCQKCGTVHTWQEHKRSGYSFLMPAKGTKVLQRCDDVFGGG